MFGLMRAKKCGMSEEEKHFRRMNYCGTCKTTGALYGQKSRFLLNHDVVFMAEILTALGGENLRLWGKSYQSFNCLNLPAGEMPLPLQFAATTNIILTEFKLADHITDEGKRRYRFAQKSFSKEFQKAEDLLKAWNFPLAEVKAILQTQTALESEIKAIDAVEILNALAAPTAQTTAIFFAEGAKLIGRNDTANAARELGAAFGKLIYLLDAFEDYTKDFSANQFNAIRAAYKLKENMISPEVKRKITAILRDFECEVIENIRALPIAENQKNMFAACLTDNLQRKLKIYLPVVRAKITCAPKPKQTFAQRWHSASEKAKNLTRGFSWQMPLVFLFIFIFALAAPAQTKEAKSARECFDLGFNLMFLGAIVGAVFSAPVLAMQNLAPDKIAEKIEKKRRSGWCDSCDCCEGCECCCCACEDGCCCCGDGCCDGCDCCNCDC